LRKILVATLIIIVALGAGVYAYWRSLPSQIGPMVTLTSPPFELSVMLDKTSYSLADNMTMTFYLRNISNETVTIEESDTYGVFNSPAFTLSTVSEGVNTSFNLPGDNPLGVLFPFGYTFSAGNGSIINKFPDGVHFNQAYSIIFQPNASLNQTLNINLNEFNASYTAPTGHPLQKGTYQVTGAFKGYLNYEALYSLETPSISFTIGDSILLPRTLGPSVSITSSPFELSIALDKTAYSHDDNMTIAYYLRNISNETITAVMPDIQGVAPNDPAITLVTVSEGVSTSFDKPGEDPLGFLFPFRYTLVYSNGTIIYEFPSTGINTIYSIVFEPDASLNQTLYVNLTRYIEIRTAPNGHPLQSGSYQVRGAFEAYLNDKGPYTWETPSIAFTIGQ
jgi:hypothetical protein